MPSSSGMHTTRNSDNITLLKVCQNFSKSVFQSVIRNCNKRYPEICNSASLEIFEKRLLNFIRPNSNNIFNINNPLGLKLLTLLRIDLSHLKEHKFKHIVQDSKDPLRSCGIDTVSTVHSFLHYVNFTTQRQIILKKLEIINISILAENENSVVRTLLFGRPGITNLTNKEIINATISFILTTE